MKDYILQYTDYKLLQVRVFFPPSHKTHLSTFQKAICMLLAFYNFEFLACPSPFLFQGQKFCRVNIG